jgi:hypothetical protein
MKRKTKIVSLISVLIIVVLSISLLQYNEKLRYYKKAKNIIQKIDEFKKENNYLPTSYLQIDIKEPDGEGPYFESINDTTYMVYYNIGFDNHLIFYSDIRKWEDDFR